MSDRCDDHWNNAGEIIAQLRAELVVSHECRNELRANLALTTETLELVAETNTAIAEERDELRLALRMLWAETKHGVFDHDNVRPLVKRLLNNGGPD